MAASRRHAATPSASAPGRVALSASLLASAHCVRGVLAGRSLGDCLAQTDAALRPSAQAISFHVMRRLGLARAVQNRLLARAPADKVMESLLLVALALLDTAIAVRDADDDASVRGVPVYAVHTVVDQAVNAVPRKLQRYRGLINGTLRNFIRQRDTLLAALAENDEAVWNYPRWWVSAIRRAWPQHWQEILHAGNQPAPMVLRVNRRRATVRQVMTQFEQAGIPAHALGEQAIWLPEPLPVHALPGFEAGLWSVQDLSAQRAAALLPVRSGMRVLDACAAPGGKTAHLLERADITLLALDADASRLQRVADNLDRLGLGGSHVALTCADASQPDDWWDGKSFDAVLADVPCTGSGVVRRNPDIRWLRRKSDILQTCALQRQILDALWRTVRPGGHLLYVTCSIFPQEGEEQATAFAARHADARRLPAPGQVLPLPDADGMVGGDGFFYALFTKADPQGVTVIDGM